MKILDSDHCVAILRGKLALARRALPSDSLATTSISVGELVLGAKKSMKPLEGLEKVDLLLRGLIILPSTRPARDGTECCGRKLEVAGRRLDDLDLQIASIAVHFGATLLTHNRRHFGRIPGLMLEDWLA